MITANAKMISKMPIDEAKRYVEQLINFQVFREIAEEQKIELTVPNIQKS
jgi:hypothetical protein